MPGALDTCINSVFEDGNIPASSGTTPVRVVLPPTNNRIVLEAAAAAAVQDWSIAAATQRQLMLAGGGQEMVFVNLTDARQAVVAPGVMVDAQ